MSSNTTPTSPNTYRKLRNYLKEVTYLNDEVSIRDLKDVFTFIDQKVFHPRSEIVGKLPFPEIYIHGIRSIIHPSLMISRMPDLLDLLAQVEYCRRCALKLATNSLVFDDYYRSQKEPTAYLTEEERAQLQRHESESDSIRGIYFTIVTQYCQLDIYSLWTKEVPSIVDLMIRMNEYFPLLNRDYKDGSPRLLHHDLSQAELEVLTETGQDCSMFIQESTLWAAERKEEGQTVLEVFQSKEFQAEYPCPVELDDLQKSTEEYLRMIESLIRELEHMFP